MSVWRMLGGRAIQAAMVALLVGVACFLMVRLLPGDMAYRIAASRYGYDLVSTQAAEAVRAELHLEAPWFVQLGTWLASVARLDLGISLASGERVSAELGIELGYTLILSLAALAISMLIGPPLGVLAGMRAGSALDTGTLVASSALRAVPSFVLGGGLMLLLSLEWDLLPAAGVGGWREVVLPALTLALGLAAGSSRVTRDVVAAVAVSPYLGFARTKGLSDRIAFQRHGARNAAIPVVTFAALQLAYVADGFVVVETLFAYPGLGDLLVKALLAADIPVIMGAGLLIGTAYSLLSLLADLLVLALDPQRRAAGRA